MKLTLFLIFLFAIINISNAQKRDYKDYCILNSGDTIKGKISSNNLQLGFNIRDSMGVIHSFLPTELKTFFVWGRFAITKYQSVTYNGSKYFLQVICGDTKFKKCNYFYLHGYDENMNPDYNDSILYYKDDSLLPEINRKKRKLKSKMAKNIHIITDSAVVYIEHTSLANGIAVLPIYLDSNYIGANGSNNYMYVILKPGMHIFTCPFAKNFRFVLDAKAGNIYYLRETSPIFPMNVRANYFHLKFTLLNNQKGRKYLNQTMLSVDNAYFH